MSRDRRLLRWPATVAVIGGLLASAAGCGEPAREPPPEPYVVWAVGDGPDGGRAAAAVGRLIAADDADRVLYLGDVYAKQAGEKNAGTESEEPRTARRAWFGNYQSALGGLAELTAPTPGNHDWPVEGDQEVVAAGYKAYWRRIRGRPQPSYYSFGLGGWEIISLNSEIASDVDSQQYEWLRSQLSYPGSCRLAFWHRPRFSAGTTNGDQDDMAPFWEALRGHASIVVSGHEHNMQRFEPIDGLTQFVSGAGGHSHYEIDRDDDRIAFANDADYGALRLELRPGSANFAFVALDGRTLDSGVVRCRPN